jgi:hypothetical protein
MTQEFQLLWRVLSAATRGVSSVCIGGYDGIDKWRPGPVAAQAQVAATDRADTNHGREWQCFMPPRQRALDDSIDHVLCSSGWSQLLTQKD